MSHTPGPWTYSPISDNFGGEIVCADGVLARTWRVRHPNAPLPMHDNGTLMSAAPDLLEALTNILAKWYAELDGGPKVTRADWDQARTAISKAAGTFSER